MRLSRQTNNELEKFFQLFFDDKNLKLPEIEVYVRNGAGFLTKLIRVDGITIGKKIFISPKLAQYDEKKRLCISQNLLSHEVAHVIQYQKSGFLGFLSRYLKDYFLNLKTRTKWNSQARLEAYWEIPHEIEARKAAKDFVQWCQKEI